MNFKCPGVCLFVCAMFFLLQPTQGQAQQSSDTARAGAPKTPAAHDGQHDFDFELGTWKIHLKRLLHPLTGSTTWVEFDGTSVTKKIWDGRAQIEQFETDGTAGHVEGLTLRDDTVRRFFRATGGFTLALKIHLSYTGHAGEYSA